MHESLLDPGRSPRGSSTLPTGDSAQRATARGLGSTPNEHGLVAEVRPYHLHHDVTQVNEQRSFAGSLPYRTQPSDIYGAHYLSMPIAESGTPRNEESYGDTLPQWLQGPHLQGSLFLGSMETPLVPRSDLSTPGFDYPSAQDTNLDDARQQTLTPSSNHDPAIQKRVSNKRAVRKYREKHITEIAFLKEELQKKTLEVDELRMKLARRESEVTTLRSFMSSRY